MLYKENVNGNEYHTLENNMRGFKKFIINNFNLCEDDNFELINKKASKTYNNGFFRDYSRKINNKDNKKKIKKIFFHFLQIKIENLKKIV